MATIYEFFILCDDGIHINSLDSNYQHHKQERPHREVRDRLSQIKRSLIT